MGETNYDTMFGRMALEQRFCTENELQKCQEQLTNHPSSEPVTMEELMINNGYITSTQATRIKSNITESKTAAHQIPGYKVLGKLGSGAMAIVYKAKQLSLDRIVAVKVLPKKFTEKEDYIKRFYKEGRLAAKLNHNNIVQAIDVGEAGGIYYFVMEYVEGKTLYDDLSRGKIFSEQEALDIIIQLANALNHAHKQGLIHRDVKPKNIMINTENVVKLADMGLARATTDVEAAQAEKGKAFGTPYYIAPEQVRGELDIDGRADIYALGATLYHMVTGKVPFDGANPSEVMKKHLKEPLTPPDHLNTELSAGLAEMVEVMMAKDRRKRYNNMDELLTDLEAVRAGKPPVMARQKFDMSDLTKLGEGEAVEMEQSVDRSYDEDTITKYRIAIVILLTLSAVLILIILFLIIKNA